MVLKSKSKNEFFNLIENVGLFFSFDKEGILCNIDGPYKTKIIKENNKIKKIVVY